MTANVLGQIGITAIEDRQISVETAVRFGVYTARRDHLLREVVPDERGNIIVFPFEERGVVVNEKFRQLPWECHKFWQWKEGRRSTFWNSDVLDDPALARGDAALVITEGEMDCLTALDCGFPFTVSVPDGAPAVPKGREPTDLEPEPESDQGGKFEFVWNNRDRLKNVKRFIIAVDNDPPGQRLAAELVRRLSAARCMFVTYPDGCKDLNAARTRHGPEAVAAVLNSAKPYPVHGLYRLSEYPPLPAIESYKTGWWTLDTLLRPFLGELMFVLGIPGHGKSAFIANMLVNLSELYGWRSVIFAPEEPTVPHMRDKLRRIRSRGRLLPLDLDEVRQLDAWLDERFLFIDADPLGQNNQEAYIDWIIERATDAVLRDGVQVLVIDPWNEIEHARLPRETQTEYIGRAIRMLNRFRHTHGVMVIVLIHPTKEVGKDGKPRAPTPYDADGSAHWYNKADHFLIIHRPDEGNSEAVIRIAKCKFEGTGEKGHIRMRFDRVSGRYEALDGSKAPAGLDG